MPPDLGAISAGKRKRMGDQSGLPSKQSKKGIAQDHADEVGSESDYSENDSNGTGANSSQPTPVATPLTPSTPSRPKVYHCDYEGCNKSFARPSRLEEHIRSHTNERPFICPHTECGKTFLRDSHLSRHVKSAHTAIRDYVCNWSGCTKSFATGTRLRRHIAAHQEKEQFRCTDYPPCNEIFRKHATLQRHIQSAHFHQKPFQCTHTDSETGAVCSAGFETSTKLYAHVRRMHTENRYYCTLCGSQEEDHMDGETDGDDVVGFATAAALREHMKAEHPPICGECNHRCSSQAELRVHVRNVHEGYPEEDQHLVTCSFNDCGKTFSKPHNLKVHIRSVHYGRKPFVCSPNTEIDGEQVGDWDGADACDNSFTTKAALIEHIRTKHLGLESKQQARKRAKREAAAQRGLPLNDEMLLDDTTLAQLTGAGYEQETGRQIPCTFSDCDYRFYRDYDLKRHLQSGHGLDEDDITDTLMERDMLSGGPFWLGGEEGRTFEDYAGFGNGEILDNELGIENQGPLAQPGPVAANGTRVHAMNFDQVEIDPELEG